MAELTTYEEWRAEIESAPGGAGLAALARVTPSGIPVGPLYGEAESVAPGLAAARRPMSITLEYDHWDPDVVRRSIAEQLGGVDGARAWVRLDRATRLSVPHMPSEAVHSGRGGTTLARADELAAWAALGVPLTFDTGANALPVAALLAAADLGEAGGALRLSFDPLAAWAKDGALPASLNDLFHDARACEVDVVVSTEPYHLAGADPIHELACALATAIDYCRALEGPPRGGLSFRISAGSDVFVDIAKLRALRWAFRRLAPEIGGPALRSIDAVASPRTHSVRDPWINQLRLMAAALAAQAGGADSFCPRPYDAAAGQASPLGARMARNAGLMLAAEAQVARVADPGAGSGFVEALTSSMARQAWDVVREIESEGGMTTALASGWIASRMAECWEALRARYRPSGGDEMVLVGVNRFRSAGEPPDVVRRNPGLEEIALRFGHATGVGSRDGDGDLDGDLDDWDEADTGDVGLDLELRGFDAAVDAARDGANLDALCAGLVRGYAASIEPLPRNYLAAALSDRGAA